MRSSKSRSRNKNRNRPQGGGNIVNRVFDSSGPEGKVRGTPAQIIDKYNQLARDAQLSGDRVALENFQQHSEHYTRMLAAAQKEIDARQGQGGQPQGQHGQQHQQGPQGGGPDDRQDRGGDQNGRFEPQSRGDGRAEPQQRADGRAEQDGERRDGQTRDGQPGRRGNRRRDRGDGEQGGGHAGADVIDVPQPDAGPVATPEGDGAAPAERPKRGRPRKKAPAPQEPAPAADDSAA